MLGRARVDHLGIVQGEPYLVTFDAHLGEALEGVRREEGSHED